jgi:hypothetical protein
MPKEKTARQKLAEIMNSGDQMRATPQSRITGPVANAVRKAQQFASQYELDPRIPLLGGTGVDELLSLPDAASLLEDVSYNGMGALVRGGNAATGGLGTFRPDPRLVSAADVAATATGVGQLGAMAARAAPGAVRAGVRNLSTPRTLNPQAGIVSTDLARKLSTTRSLPQSETFQQAVANTPGASITDDGLMMALQRGQKIEQEMAPSVRGGVFYLPKGAAQGKHYSKDSGAYGGSEKVTGETSIANPLFVKGATGGRSPEQAYIELMGKDAFKALQDELMGVISYGNKNMRADVGNFLSKYAPELEDYADYIVDNSKQGNQLRYALQEAAIGSAARNAGHDAIVGYSKKRTGDPFISEVFDVREVNYPSQNIESEVFEQFVQPKESVHFSDNPDVMQLELAGGGLVGKLAKAAKPAPMKASEALGRIEGRPLVITQSDRTKVGGGFLGGPGFSGLQLTEPEYRAAEAVWGVKTPGAAKMIIGGGKKAGADPVYTTFIGTPNQHQSNQMVFDKLLGDFKKSAKKGGLDPELKEKINYRLANAVDKDGRPIFPPDVDILDKNFKDLATTFDQRAVTSSLIGGFGVGGKKGQIIDYDKIIRNTTDPALIDVPSGALGNRLFTLSGGIIDRPDLHPAFPTILQGEDLGVSFEPVIRDLVMKDFIEKTMREKGRPPGYMDYTRGHPPSQLITEDILTEMQKMGKKAGGAVRKAEGGEITADDLILEERKL